MRETLENGNLYKEETFWGLLITPRREWIINFAGGMMNQWYFQIRFNELLTKDYGIEDMKEILEKKYEELEKLISTFSY